MKEEVSKHQETLSPAGLWGVLESQRASKLGGEKKKTKDYIPNRNSQWRSSPDTRVCHQRVGLNREVQVACLG